MRPDEFNFWIVTLAAASLYRFGLHRLRPFLLLGTSLVVLYFASPWAVCAFIVMTFGIVAAQTYLTQYSNYVVIALIGASLFIFRLFEIRPLGFSFYSLIALSLILDRPKGVQFSPMRFVTGVGFFPLLYSGPIVSCEKQIFDRSQKSNQTIDWVLFGVLASSGFLLRAALTIYSPHVPSLLSPAQEYSVVSGLNHLIFLLSYLYIDFQSYMFLVGAAASLFCVELPSNFLSPFSSTTPNEFWRRWHVTLGDWFARNIYIPLQAILLKSAWVANGFGAKAVGRLAVIATWLMIGWWHDISIKYTVWGILNGSLCLIPWVTLLEAIPESFRKLVGRTITLMGFALSCLVLWTADLKTGFSIVVAAATNFTLRIAPSHWQILAALLPVALLSFSLIEGQNWILKRAKTSLLFFFLFLSISFAVAILLIGKDRSGSLYSAF